jgi:hypothetical protein
LENNSNGSVVFVVELKQIVRYRKFTKIARENKRKIGNFTQKLTDNDISLSLLQKDKTCH